MFFGQKKKNNKYIRLDSGEFSNEILQFKSLTLGYESTNASSTIQTFWDLLQYRRTSLYPGEGDRLLGLLQEVEHYQYNIDELDQLKSSAEAMMRIVDRILAYEYSILSQQV